MKHTVILVRITQHSGNFVHCSQFKLCLWICLLELFLPYVSVEVPKCKKYKHKFRKEWSKDELFGKWTMTVAGVDIKAHFNFYICRKCNGNLRNTYVHFKTQLLFFFFYVFLRNILVLRDHLTCLCVAVVLL